MLRRPFSFALTALAALLLGSCGGGGGGGGAGGPVDPDGPIGVFSGVSASFDFDWEAGGGDGGVGGGGDGDGGVGAGGDFGQFRNALVRAYKDDGTLIGEAPTDEVNGMVTIKPGRTYAGGLCVELIGGVHGGKQATYYEEGRDQFVPFPAGKTIRVRVAKIDKNVGLTALTEAAFRHLHGGANADCRTRVTAAQIRASNTLVKNVLNQQFPRALEVDDITRLPHIKSSSLPQGTISTDPRGRYGLVNGALSKQAAMFASARTAPTLDLLEQIAEDLIDGQLDGRRGTGPAAPAELRTYEPNTFTGELSSALAQQAARFGSQEALDALPPILNFGNLRYEGYLFDGSITKSGRGYSTVSGWVADNSLNRKLGDFEDKLPASERAFSFFGNHGHGGGFYKSDATGTPRIYAFGDNVNGELGTGSTAASPDVTEITDKLPAPLTHAAGGFSHTVVRLADGSVWAWGDNSFGQLGVAPATLARSLVPRRVALAQGAVAVAATSVASYALLVDGSVVAWGSNGGFGLLGNGNASAVVPAPTAVGGLADVVQIAARDNDVVVLKRDNTVWTWGSFPADATAFVPGDPTQAYEGGRLVPAPVAGLPASRKVRKVLTEQGLFVALLDNGHVYTWGVYFDITAGGILRDLNAVRILGLPPLRDLMPGGFNGYGVRAFDRMTAMGIDYRGGMWKLRGRVAEQFDPAKPAQQRRPQVQSPRPDCINCHLFLNDWPLVPDPPTSSAVCDPIGNRPDIHGTRTAPLVHRDTECQQCHNPARNPPIAAFPEGWLACVRPTDLPLRPTPIDPPLLTNACTIPPGHVFTPPGTVCASCHNSIIAQPLQEKGCAQPDANLLPTIPTTATITGAFADGNVPIAPNGLTADATPELRGTLSAALAAGHQLRVLRNGTGIGTATVSGSGWSFVDANAGQGTRTYTVRVQATTGGGFGPTSNGITLSVDTVVPTTVADVTAVTDDALGTIAAGGFASDTTPRVSGTLQAPLAAGEQIQLRRNGAQIALFGTSGSTWSYTEPTALAAGSYTWQARVVDGAGNAAALGASRAATIVTSMPTTAISAVRTGGGSTIPPNGVTTERRPVVAGTVGSALPAGYVVRVLRSGASAGTANVSGTGWTFTEPANLADGSYTYTARVEAGAVLGSASTAYAIRIDATAPTQTADVTTITDDVLGAIADNGFASDTTPTVSGTLSAALAAGESVQVQRNGATAGTAVASGTAWSFTEPTAIASGSHSYRARVVDAAGNLGAFGSTRTVNILGGVAGATITSVTGVRGAVIEDGGFTTARRPTVNGSVTAALPAGHVLSVLRNGDPAGTATVTTTSWTFTEAADLADGAYAYTARVEAGSVTGPQSTAYTVNVDGTAPAQAVTVTGFADDFIGDLNNPATTADTTPTVKGTLSAPLAAGERVRIQRGATGGGSFVTVASVTASGTAWSYTEQSELAAGGYDYVAQVIDPAGNLGPLSSALTIRIDPGAVPLPNAATTLETVNGITPSNNAIPASTDTTPTLAGTIQRQLVASPAEVVRVYRDGSAIGNATVPVGALTWSFTDTARPDGTPLYKARIEQFGNSAVFGAFSAEIAVPIDTTAPTQSASVSGIFDDAGTAVTNNATADTTPRIAGTLSAGLGSGESVQLLRGGVVVATPTVAGTSWSFTEASALAAGSYTYSARVVDAAGNLGPTTGATAAVTVVTNLPNATVAAVAYSGSGLPQPSGTVVANGGTIADATPTVTVSLSASLPGGYLVRVFRDGTSIGTATGCGTSCAVTDGGAAEGLHAYTARTETGTALGATSAAYSVTVDTVAPTVTASVTAIRDDANFAYADNGFTTDTTPLVQGTLSVGLGAGEQLQVLRNGVVVATPVPVGTSWSVLEPSPLIGAGGSGSFAYAARVRDAVGNVGTTSAARTINVVGNLPATTITSINGSASNPLTTNDTTPQINLTLSANLPSGYVVRVLRNGTPLAGALTACAPSCAFTDSVTTNQTYNYTARTEAGGSANVVGTALGSTSNTRSIVLDTVDPPAPTFSAVVNNKPYEGSTVDSPVAFSTGEFIADPDPQLTLSYGSLGANESIQIRRNGSLIFTLTSASANPFVFTHPTALSRPNGANTSPPTVTSGIAVSYTAERFDAAGNSSTASFGFTINYENCSQARALAKVSTTGHAHTIASNWVAGSGNTNCTGCHHTDIATSFVAAPPPGVADRYWCRKP